MRPKHSEAPVRPQNLPSPNWRRVRARSIGRWGVVAGLTAPASTSLGAVMDNLEKDHEFLTAGNVFTPDLIETWISYKRQNEILPVQLRPHPHEFELYYDI